jgi:uncharacterized membrane protein
MNLQHAVMLLAEQHKLSKTGIVRLRELAEGAKAPAQMMNRAPGGIATFGALLSALGTIFLIAANWNGLSRATHFSLLEGMFAVACISAAFFPRARLELGLFAFYMVGAVLAFFGMTYQTGADPWELFALWTLLTLPLCLGAKHDVLWASWIIVATTAAGLWAGGQALSGVLIGTAGYGTLYSAQLLHWLGASLVTLVVYPRFRTLTQAGIWALRFSVLLTAMIIAGWTGLDIYTNSDMAFLGLSVLGIGAVIFSRPKRNDVFVLCVIGLYVNYLVMGVLGKVLLLSHVELFGSASFKEALEHPLAYLALAGACLMALTVNWILQLQAQHVEENTHE